MENTELRKQFNMAKDSFIEKIEKNKKCLAAFLYGSNSHDLIWEWSDLQILIIIEDGYKWPIMNAIEHDIPINTDVRKKTDFLKLMASATMTHIDICTFSKSTPLFVKDPVIQKCFDDMFYIGERDKEAEMILGFSHVVWCMNKAEKNYYVKKNVENTIYFLFKAAETIAWLEVAKHKLFPEREIIAQAKLLNPELFQKIYDRMIYEPVTESLAEEILMINLDYLKKNTEEVYRPVLVHLQKYGDLDKFSMPMRSNGYGLDLLWLCRMGILEREIKPLTITTLSEEFFTYKYVLSEQYK